MRYIIIGNHASGKHKILDALEELGVEVGREFTTSPTKIFDLDPKAHQITQLEVEELFKNQDTLLFAISSPPPMSSTAGSPRPNTIQRRFL